MYNKEISAGTAADKRTAVDNITSASLVQNGLLAAGFKNFNEQMRFAKILSIATIYQQDPEWEDAIKITVKMNCNQEARRLKFPDGWQLCGSYPALKEWFMSACR